MSDDAPEQRRQRESPGPITDRPFGAYSMPTRTEWHAALQSTLDFELVAAAATRSQVVFLIAPGSDVGAQPAEIPLSGHNVVLALVNNAEEPVTIDLIDAELRGVQHLNPIGVMQSSRSESHPLVLSEDLLPSVEEAVAGYRSLYLPHVEILLDTPRPVLQVAAAPDGTPVRGPLYVPFTIKADEAIRLVLAPVTQLPALVTWRLFLHATLASRDAWFGWDFMVTGFTGSSVLQPNADPVPATVADMAADHWDPYTYIADERLPHEADHHLRYTMVANPLWLDDKFGGRVLSDGLPDAFAMTDNAQDGTILPQDDST
jgi:hypothetical protein